MKSLTLLALAAAVATAASVAIEDYPNPAKTAGCLAGEKRANVDRICDPNLLLSDGEAKEAQMLAMEIHRDIPHKCGGADVPGFEVAVALMQELPEASGHKLEASAAARRLHDAWGVGHKHCNDGVVILLAISDRQVYISTGAGVKSMVTDGHVQAIIARMRPSLRAGKLEDAVMTALADLKDILARRILGSSHENAELEELAEAMNEELGYGHGRSRSGSSLWGAVAQLMAIFGFAGVMAVSAWWQQRKLQKRRDAWQECRKRLLEIERLRDEIQSEETMMEEASPPADHGHISGTGLRRRNNGGQDHALASEGARRAPIAARMTCCPICFEDFPSNSSKSAASSASNTVIETRSRAGSDDGDDGSAEDGAADGLLHSHDGDGAGGGAGATAGLAATTTAAATASQPADAAASTTGSVVTLPCSHRFHIGCLDKWFEGQRKNTCPVCRSVTFDRDPDYDQQQQQQQPRRPTVQAAQPNAGAAAAGGGDGGAGNDDDTNCRPASAAGAGATAGGTAAAPQAAGMTQAAELEFLLRNLGRRYPLFVTGHMIDTWILTGRLAAHRGTRLNLAVDPTFVAVDPSRDLERLQQRLNADRNWGSGARWGGGSFGGGSSFGGGGGGGGW